MFFSFVIHALGFTHVDLKCLIRPALLGVMTVNCFGHDCDSVMTHAVSRSFLEHSGFSNSSRKRCDHFMLCLHNLFTWHWIGKYISVFSISPPKAGRLGHYGLNEALSPIYWPHTPRCLYPYGQCETKSSRVNIAVYSCTYKDDI